MRTPTTLIPVKDCMSRQFVSFRADTPVVEATTALVGNELLGGPVLDADGRLIGWVSEHDCLNVVLQVAYYSERVATVGDIMRRDVLTADPEGSALDLANAMQQQKPKQYPVVDGSGRVQGVVSRRQILRRLCAQIGASQI